LSRSCRRRLVRPARPLADDARSVLAEPVFTRIDWLTGSTLAVDTDVVLVANVADPTTVSRLSVRR
jgi:hypothetical protein